MNGGIGILPGVIWTPRTEAELSAAIANGELNESHTLDFKRELGSSDGAKKDFAKDVAAFSVDGGTILIGVDEGPPVTVSPVNLAGLPERVEQIAAMRVDEGVMVETTAIEIPSGSGKGVLVVNIPASPRAPHMAGGRYYGRGDKTNYQMSHAEVLRRHAQLVQMRHDVLEELHRREMSMTEGVIAAADGGALLLLAKPLGAPRHLLKPLTSRNGWQSVLVEIVRQALIPGHHNFVPTFGAPAQDRRPNGVALITGMQPGDVFSGASRQAELVAYENGDLLLQSGRAVMATGKDRVVLEELIVGHAELLVRFAAGICARYGFAGSWQFGLLVTGLAGGNSALLRTNWANSGYTYADNTYEAATTATLMEITKSPAAVVEDLVGGLLRSLGSHEALPWLQLRDDQQP